MTEERAEKRKRCFELMRHPKNRAYFERILNMLQDNGIYGWVDMQETFTKEEIRKALREQDGTSKEEEDREQGTQGNED